MVHEVGIIESLSCVYEYLMVSWDANSGRTAMAAGRMHSSQNFPPPLFSLEYIKQVLMCYQSEDLSGSSFLYRATNMHGF